LFRHLLWLWHCKKRVIVSSNFLCYLNYIIFFPTILAGPIDSYNNFQYWFYQKRNSFAAKLPYAGVTRLLLGAFKTLILVPLLIDKATNYELFLSVHSPAFSIFLSSIYYSFYIYFDFSGYSDLAIGTSYLLGIKTPENFDNPYLSTNLSEFWKRWHITFSKILSDLFFKPFVRFLNKLLNLSSSKMYVSILGYLFTFIICGLWHGSTLNFLLWGLWHGIGLALLKVWQTSTSNFNQLKSTSVFQMLAIAINFSFVSIGWIFFNYKVDQLLIMQNLLLN
jgi:D-alanyl-lipoteichoic acid acyltransferase DltB (MBOAT superfamily)